MQGLFSLNDDNKMFYKVLVSLCIPIIIQQLISTSVNVIDTMMVSSLGETSVASIGVANQFFFLFSMSLSGITGGAGIFISQFFGKGDTTNIRKVTGFTVILAVLLSLIFFVPALIIPTEIIHIFSYDPEVIRQCTEYFSIVVFCYPLIAISSVFSVGSRGIRNPKLGMICSSVALIVNIILNYGLIFGNLGMPMLGVKGAALATVIARIVEFSLIIGYVYFFKKDYTLKFGIKELKLIDKEFSSSFLKTSFPIFLNDTAWAIGTVLYSVAFSALVFITGLIFGGLLILNIPLLLNIFSVTPNLAPDITKIFIIMGILMALKSFNTLIIIGVLRSGGDTRYALFLELGCMWLVSIPLTFIAAFKGAPIYVLVLLTYSEELVKFIFGVPRALSKKWAANIVKEMN